MNSDEGKGPECRGTHRAFTLCSRYGSSWYMFSEHTISCSLNGF